jgi:hypothetical protein
MNNIEVQAAVDMKEALLFSEALRKDDIWRPWIVFARAESVLP